jgi:hypothetical protein
MLKKRKKKETCNSFSPPRPRDHVSQTYKTNDKIVIMYMYVSVYIHSVFVETEENISFLTKQQEMFSEFFFSLHSA